MVRYTFRLGIHYARPYDFRNDFDYPWHKRIPYPPSGKFAPGVAAPTIVNPLQRQPLSDPTGYYAQPVTLIDGK